jgi:hypothetical protein
MDDRQYFGTVAGLAVLAVVLFVAAGALWSGPEPAGSVPSSSSGPTVYRNLTIQLDPASGTYSYNSGQVVVPLNTRIVFTITNYDPTPARSLPSPSDSQVSGTMGGVMLAGEGMHMMTTNGISPASVAHTFSMSDRFHHLNVPIPAATGSGPSQVQFTVVFTSVGTFDWGCVILCGMDDMSAPGSMYGTLAVQP